MKAIFEGAGEIVGIDLLAAFVAIWRRGTSGTLRFSRNVASAGFDLTDGEIAAASSSESRFETAAILVRAGKLDAAALERLSVPPGTDGALAALQTGILTRREWKWGQKIRAIEILADLLSWPDGKYVLDPDARPVAGEFVLTVPRLLLELFLRSRDRNLVEHQLGPMDAPLVRSERFEEEFASFGLTADAESVVRLIDGGATAAEISERAPAEEFAVLKLLAALKTLGLLGTEQRPRQEKAEPQAEKRQPATEAEPPPFGSWTASESLALSHDTGSEQVPAQGLGDVPLTQPAGGTAEGSAQPSQWGRSHREPARDEPLEEAEEPELEASVSEPDSVAVDWEPSAAEPLDRPLDMPAELSPVPGGPGQGRGLLWGAALLLLITAVAGVVVLRSRPITHEAPVAARRLAAGRAPAPTPSTLALTAPPMAVAPTPPPTRAAEKERLPSPIPKVRPDNKSGAAAARLAPSQPDRAQWEQRAHRFLRRLASEKKTRYAIQLELACEIPSLTEAWRHDSPSGSMWLVPTSHGGHECFRVLWGRFASLEQARRAKGAIPSYFVTATNHPAVVSVR